MKIANLLARFSRISLDGETQLVELMKMNQNKPKWTKMNQNEPKWTKMNQNEPKWTKMNQNEPKWTQLTKMNEVNEKYFTMFYYIWLCFTSKT